MFHTFSNTSPFNIPPSPDFLYPLGPPPPPRHRPRLIPRRRRKKYLSRPDAYRDPPAVHSALDTAAMPHRALFAGVYDAYDNKGLGYEDDEVERAGTRRGARGERPAEMRREGGVWVDGVWVDGDKKRGKKGFWAYVRVEGVSEDVLRGAVEELMGEGEMNFGAFGTFTREDRRKLPLPGWAVKEGREFGSTAQTAKVDVADEQLLRYNYFRGIAEAAEADKWIREGKRLRAEYMRKLSSRKSPPEPCPEDKPGSSSSSS